MKFFDCDGEFMLFGMLLVILSSLIENTLFQDVSGLGSEQAFSREYLEHEWYKLYKKINTLKLIQKSVKLIKIKLRIKPDTKARH